MEFFFTKLIVAYFRTSSQFLLVEFCEIFQTMVFLFVGEYFCCFKGFLRFYQCSLKVVSCTATVDIWLTKQIQVAYMQSPNDALLNSSPEKRQEHV